MSESIKSDDSFEQSMATLKRITNLIKHDKEHVTLAPVRTKLYDPHCEGCKRELSRIHKLSDNLPAVNLGEKAHVTISFVTLLCHLQMHNECAKDYVMQTDLIELHCSCPCHEKEKRRMKKQANASTKEKRH
jgi:hypothetical protein